MTSVYAPYAGLYSCFLTMMHPKMPLKKTAHIIALGSTTEASFNSSDIWAPASGPMKHHSGVERPTSADTPIELHSPPFVHVVKTSSAGERSAMVQKRIRKAKKANTCKTRTIPSARGRCCARKMLNPTMSINQSIIRSVTCHSFPISASGYARRTIPTTRLESICAHAGMPLTHPTAADHPGHTVSALGTVTQLSPQRTHDVTERLLERWWCELADPMILATGSWSHRCHLSERCDHR